ncbi:MAG: malto-oligosyltrehalose synthase [Bowdeniella nasicola]|nr:malto-oligosyltrehalose synthase [Bowdeniella nasicola]
MPHPQSHVPAANRRTPITTYRLQLTEDFTFDTARTVLPYLAALGVSDLYLSPILQAAPGSTHGYDVVDHTAISVELGGRDAFERLAEAAHDAGLGVLVDLVPNHMAVPTPAWHNRALWSVLKEGEHSPYAHWFDVDFGSDGLLMPVLGDRIGAVLARGELVVEELTDPGSPGGTVLRYFDHVFPVRSGTEQLPLAELVERQHYRLAYWKVADEETNYRRFFDVGTLAAVRVEIPDVFDATHALLLDLLKSGHIDAFRVDHPDGLADPQGYFERLHEATGGAYVVAEKILEGDEKLPEGWPVAGTTGYDAAWRIGGVQIDPHGATDLASVMTELTGDLPGALDSLIEEAKRQIIATSLQAEVDRIAALAAEICHDDIRLRDHTKVALKACLIELVVAIDRYRAYVRPATPGEAWHDLEPEQAETLAEAARTAAERLPEDMQDTLAVVMDLITGTEVGSAGRTHEERRAELAVRFQQVCGAVTAKGVEDTAYYRYTLLASLTEVGGDPHAFGVHPDDLIAWAQDLGRRFPLSMTLGTTHDTKRGEDVRARLAALTQGADMWRELVARHAHLFAGVDGRMTNLLWQILYATHGASDPMTASRLSAFAVKAAREEKTFTTWTAPDEEAEQRMVQAACTALNDPQVLADFRALDRRLAEGLRVAILATKAIQLTLIGVADIYQGSEVIRTSLVDPDNRRPVDFEALYSQLRLLDGGARPQGLDQEKLALTAAITRLRRTHHEAFLDGEITPLPTTTAYALAYARGADRDVVVVAERLGARVSDRGGFATHEVVLEEGSWRDILTGRTISGGPVRLAELLDTWPVAVVVRA